MVSQHTEPSNPNIHLNQLGMSSLEAHVIVPELFPTLELGIHKHMITTNIPRGIELSSPFFFLKIDQIEFHIFDHNNIGQ